MLKYLPDSYYQHLIGCDPKEVTANKQTIINQRLAAFGLETLEDNSTVVELPIPDGFGSITEELELSYVEYDVRWNSMLSLLTAEPLPTPDSWYCPVGWSYWNGKSWTPHTAPSGKTFICDAETVEVSEGQWHPTCMVLRSASGWMAWKADMSKVSEVSVVPFGNDNTIIGYNICYDRSFMSSEYFLADSGNAFVDLMSMWIVTRGMTNQQRLAYAGFKKAEANDDKDGFDLSRPSWVGKTGSNGLAAVYKHYLGKELDKGVRDNIVEDGLPWCIDNIEAILKYCALDVAATLELASTLVPEYTAHRPSKVNRYGAIALGSCWLPLSADRFPGYYDRVESVYQERKQSLNQMLMDTATAYLSNCPVEDRDITALDWEAAKTGANKGLPVWYRKVIADYKKGKLSMSQRFAPIVLGLTWLGQQVYWDEAAKGWATTEHGLIPHPTKRGQAVASMMLKDFAPMYDAETIGCDASTKELVMSNVSVINWVSSRKRVQSIHTESPEGFPVVIPMMAPNGTVTGRATDSIWQVLANPKKNRIGTELKSMVAPPPGYALVGADVDSQEAWLGGLHGDEDLGICASTPFGAINAMGSSKTKTDIHSLTSTKTGYSRDTSKTRVYGALYGQGIKGDSDVILKNDPTLSDNQAKADSKVFIEYFKGKKNWEDGSYRDGLASHAFTQMEKLADGYLPKTPLTGAFMTKALAGLSDYKPTRVNWIVQSSGVDFRDMLVLLTNSFYKKLNVNGRLVLTIHDELRTLVKNEDITKAVYALQLAHLYTRAAFIRAHGLDNIPAGAAYFSAVDVDSICLRKDPSDPQVTPTQPALPLGMTVNAKQLLGQL